MIEKKTCPRCGNVLDSDILRCPNCGEYFTVGAKSYLNISSMPKELEKFNWGAFLLTWIWGIGSKVYIALLILPLSLFSLGFLNIPFAIWLGLEGNRMAWENGEWESAEQFNKVQKTWALWGVIITALVVTFIILFTVFLVILFGYAVSD